MNPPIKKKNRTYRNREYLTPAEIDRLISAARKGRYGHRDATMVLVAFRHGLRVSELVELSWSQIDFSQGVIHISRKKGGVNSVQPMTGNEIRALRKLWKNNSSSFVFLTERKGPLSESNFRKIINRAAREAEFSFSVHPHMLRHSCGYKLANDGIDTRAIQLYLGHKQIRHTVQYTELAADRFNGFWKD
jgi:site-specific recombinase XerD